MDPPAYEAHVSAYAYAGPVRALLLLYKDQRRYPLASLLGRAAAPRGINPGYAERWE